MRRIIVTEFISLDGVIDSPGNGSYPHAGWTFTDVPFDAAAYEIKEREQLEADAMLLGRVSYDEFAAVWPTMDDFAGYNSMRKYVVSTTLENPAWNNTRILRTIDEVAALKEAEGGNIIVHGSATLAKALAAAQLVDRYHLLIFPVLLGAGRRLFDETAESSQKLELVEHEAYSNGIVKAVYDVAR